MNFRLISCTAGLLLAAAGLALALSWHLDPGWAKGAAWWFLVAGYLTTAFSEPWRLRRDRRLRAPTQI